MDGIAHQGFAQHHAQIAERSINAAARNHHAADEAQLLIEKESVYLLGGTSAQSWIEVVVDVFGGAK